MFNQSREKEIHTVKNTFAFYIFVYARAECEDTHKQKREREKENEAATTTKRGQREVGGKHIWLLVFQDAAIKWD